MQRSEIVGDGLQLFSGQCHARHPGSWLDVLWIGDPTGEITARVGNRPIGERCARHKMREIRSIGSASLCTAYGMTAGASAFENGQPRFTVIGLRRLGGLQLRLPPGFELVRSLGDDTQRHMGVLQAAVFGALAEVRFPVCAPRSKSC